MTLSRRLYQLQSRLTLTGPEATAILVLTGLLALGTGVRHLQARGAPPAAALAADVREVTPDTVAAGPAVGPASEAAATPADSVAIPTSGFLRESGDFADAPPSRSRGAADSPVRMNLNTADAALLQRLPRIGPALAGRIIAYREANGPFRRVEDVVNVKGIGPKTLEHMAPWLYVE